MTLGLIFFIASVSFKLSLCYNSSDPLNVLLLSYHRSGSSFTGELLSSHEEGAYYFEPLHYVKFMLKTPYATPYRQFLSRLLTCDPEALDGVRDQPAGSLWIARKFGPLLDTFRPEQYSTDQVAALCRNTSIHVAKVIRLRVLDAAKMVAEGWLKHLKIIHLVRDPRARINSVRGQKTKWGDQNRTPADSVCEDMELDLRFGDTLSPNIYKLVRYEDLAANTTGVLTDIYTNFFKTPVTPAITNYISQHTEAEKVPEFDKESTQYFSTYRSSDFKADHWRTELDPEIIQLVQQNPKCKYVLDKLNYPIIGQ